MDPMSLYTTVRHDYDQQRRTGCEAWCEERAGTASPAASVRAKGCVFVSPINHEKQRGDVRRNGAGADLLVVRPRGFANMTERLHLSQGGPWLQGGGSRPVTARSSYQYFTGSGISLILSPM